MTGESLDSLQQALSLIAVACAPVVAGWIVVALNKLAKKWGLDAVQVDQSRLEQQITTALNFGIQSVLPQIQQHGWNSPQVHELILRTATTYFHNRFPDRSKQLGSADDDASPTYAALSARLPTVAAAAAASPSTPDAPEQAGKPA